MRTFRFFKGQALGNDYLVVDRADLPSEFTADERGMDRRLAVRMCDRHRGAGSDGVLVGDLATDPLTLRIINPDGTPAEKSGNGLRIFGAWLFYIGAVSRYDWFDVALPKDTVSMRIEEDLDDGAVMVRVRMGRARFDGQAVAFRDPGNDAAAAGGASGRTEVLDHELALPRGGSARINTVSLGNPHCVVFVDALDRQDFLERTPQLCTHAAFAEGTNVQMARVAGPRDLEILIWERGAGETLASGSSACAATAAAVRRGFVEPGEFTVHMPGGDAAVSVSADFEIELAGMAQVVYRAEWLEGR